MAAAATTSDRIAAAARQLLERGGPGGVSIRRVAAAVGLSAMAIYRHYPNREALLGRVVDDAFEQLAAALARSARGGPRARLLSAFDGYVVYALEHPHLFDYAFSAPRRRARRFPADFRRRRSPTLNLVADALAEGMRRRVFRRADVWPLAMSLWGHSHGLIVLFRGGRFSDSRRAFRMFHRAAVRRFLHGLAP